MTSCTKAAYARRHNVSRQAVGIWDAAGRIVMIGGAVDIEKSDALLLETAERKTPKRAAPVQGAPEIGGIRDNAQAPNFVRRDDESIEDAAFRLVEETAGESFDTSKARKEKYAGLLNQLEFDTKSGLVVMIADVAQAVGEQFATVRTKLLAIPSEHAPRLVRLKTANEMQDALLELVTEALSELTYDATRK